jgi:DnaJ-class molecular chaperone
MKPEEKPQEPLKTPCRMCGGGKGWLMYHDTPEGDRILWRESCSTCKGTGYEEKP